VIARVYKDGAEGVRGQWHVMAPVRWEPRDMTGDAQFYLPDVGIAKRFPHRMGARFMGFSEGQGRPG